MAEARDAGLSAAETEHFITNGYVILKNCFARDIAQSWTDQAFDRLGYDPGNPDTWEKPIVWLDHHNKKPVAELAPKAWAAICDIVGGEDRIDGETKYIESKHFTCIEPLNWSDAFVVNFRMGADKPWQEPSAEHKGWHKDGSFFRHFLDSYEQALLVIVIWSDIAPKGGGTFIAPDSIDVMAKFFLEHPEGVDPKDFDFQSLIAECSEFIEVTGEVGDVIIMHPFMLHASSPNHSGKVRFITNPPVILKEPLNLNREDKSEFSPLELATLRALGKDRLEFQLTRPRRNEFLDSSPV
ncbi:MAG: phytanoyl-CoA dioxygenase family protein [Trueperaceae bacterium]|nr:phytanoyl-CoA dioxygenase family protein [Trueperaceae bacterium]